MSWVLAALPLQIGYAVPVVTFFPWARAEDTTTYRVTGSETLTLRVGTADTRVVREERGPADKAIRQRWIDKATGRTLRTFDAPRPVAPGDGYWKVSTLVAPPGG